MLMEKALYDLEKNARFQNAFPRHTDEEYAILEGNIGKDGVLDTIKTWRGVIVDGYTRYEICHKHKIPFAIEELDFANEDEAYLWIIRNQLGRRNLPPFVKCELVLPLEEQLRAEAKERQGIRNDLNNFVENFPQSEAPAKTRDTLGAMAGVSGKTLMDAKWLHNNADPDTLDQLRQGKISIHKAYTTLKDAEPVHTMPGYGLVKAPDPTPEGVSFRAPDSVYDEPPIEVYGLAPAEDLERRSKTEMTHVSSDLKTNTDRFVYRVSQILEFLSPTTINEENIAALKDIITEGYNNIMKLIEEKGGFNHE